MKLNKLSLNEEALEKKKISKEKIVYLKDKNNKFVVLGKGAFGIVYLGELWCTQVAVKKIYIENEQNYKYLKNELMLLNEISHPNLIKLLAWTEDEESLYIITEYIEGGDLMDLLNTNSLNIKEKIEFIKNISSAMLYLHSYNPPIIHRDLKSSNVLISVNKDRAYVIDYGLSKQLTTTYLKKTNEKEGTLLWMDPEILARTTMYDTKSDVYSFGILLWEILTEKLPYSNESYFNLLEVLQEKIIKGTRPDLSLLKRDTPVNLVELMKSCWDGNKEKRPSFEMICNDLKLIN